MAQQAPRRGLLARLGEAHWGWFAGLGVALIGAGLYRDATPVIIHGAITIALGVVLRVVRGR